MVVIEAVKLLVGVAVLISLVVLTVVGIRYMTADIDGCARWRSLVDEHLGVEMCEDQPETPTTTAEETLALFATLLRTRTTQPEPPTTTAGETHDN